MNPDGGTSQRPLRSQDWFDDPADAGMTVRRQRELQISPYPVPAAQAPWQEIQRAMVSQLSAGMVLEPAVTYQKVAQKNGVPRHSH